MRETHESLVARQFGPRAEAYVDSAVHARGEDLAELADRVAALAARGQARRVLDLGCGGGHVSFTLAPHAGRVTAFDLSAEMLAAVARTAAARGLDNVETRQGGVDRLPFADASFDLLASRYSAHHWPDLGAALAEARRVLKSGGRAWFIDVVSPGPAPLDSFLQTVEMLRDPSHARDYGLGEWRDKLEAAGFTLAGVTRRKLRLEFASWIARIATPPLPAQAIRALQAATAQEMRDYFAVEADGSFTVDVASIEVTVC